MRKYIVKLMLVCVTICALGLAACGEKKEQKGKSFSRSGEKLKIVTTVFPQYSWVKEILGSHADRADITMLLDKGVDLHSYQPTTEDILKISSCDLFIYVGGESDEWVEEVLKKAPNKDRKVISLIERLGKDAKQEEIVEGMEAEHEEEHEKGEEKEPEIDEHVWLSLKNAAAFCKDITTALEELDPERAEDYRANADTYIKKLDSLHQEYQETIASAGQKTIVFADRFPFRYLAEDYGLSYYAAFAGCSAETEASFETIAFLSGKTDELHLKSIFVIENSGQKIAKTVIENTKEKNQQILTLDSMQSVTTEDAAKGITYLSVMEKNLNALKEALN